MSDKQILESKGWLNDVIMDTSMNLLKCQFPELEGFEPCYLAYNGGLKDTQIYFSKVLIDPKVQVLTGSQLAISTV